MKPLSNYIGEELVLIQPSLLKRRYEFNSSSELLAQMYFPKFFSLTAVVDCFDSKYEIFKPNFLNSKIEIRKYGNELSFAVLTANFFRTKGTIVLPKGEIVNLKFGMFKKICGIDSEMGELLLEIKKVFSFKGKDIVTIVKPSIIIDENPWIIMMVWYFLI
jgi:hypothetical protein